MKFEHEEGSIKITFELTNDGITVGEVYEQFKCFLLACGYHQESINKFYIQTGEERSQE